MPLAAATQPDFWGQLASWSSLPTRTQYVDLLTSAAILQALFLIIVGTVYLLCGWKMFKVLVVANACLIGGIFGGALGARMTAQNMQVIGALTGGVLFGILALPVMKYAVATMGALAGSFIGYGLWTYVAGLSNRAEPTQYAWAGALLGLIALGMFGLVLMRETVIIFTSLQGALLTITGLLALAMKWNSFQQPLEQNIVNNIHLLPVLVIAPTLVGIVCQNSGMAKKQKAKKAKQPAVA